MSAEALRNPAKLGAPLRFGPGRRAAPLRVEFAGELTTEDLIRAAQTEPPVRGKPHLQKIRQSHHRIARLMAQGIKDFEVSNICGMDPVYVRGLRSDPGFANLLAYYESLEAESYKDSRADMHERLAGLGHDSVEILHERLLETPEAFTIKDLRQIIEATADRTGFGKQSKVAHEHTHSISEETLKRVKVNADAPAAIAQEDRETLLRLAAGRTAQALSDPEETPWIEGEGRLVREEAAEAPGEEVSDSGTPLAQVDQVPRQPG